MGPVTERRYRTPDGQEWIFTEREHVRRGEEGRLAAVMVRSQRHSRIVICLRGEWDAPEPDLDTLLVASMPSGASKAATPPPAP
jgi:hypothetical protein